MLILDYAKNTYFFLNLTFCIFCFKLTQIYLLWTSQFCQTAHFNKSLLKTNLRRTYVKLKGEVKQTLSLFCEYGFC